MGRRLRTSPSSQMRTTELGSVSLSGPIEAASVHTAPHPPSAFIRRCPAWVPGRSKPVPVQWGTW